MNFKTSKKAYTLVELSTMLIVLSIIVLITIPSALKIVKQKQFIQKYQNMFSKIEKKYIPKPKNDDYKSYFNMPFKNEPQSGNIFQNYNEGKGITLRNNTKPAGNMKKQGKYIFEDKTEITIFSGSKGMVTSTNMKENAPNLKNPKEKGVFNAVGLLDVNGEANEPNTIGKDIFPIWLLTTGIYPNPLPSKYNALYAKEISYFYSIQHLQEPCDKNSTGATCSSEFLNNPNFKK